MGLVQRKIEAAGISTVTLSNLPALTEAVSVPRLVGIEYPAGQQLGKPGDAAGQRAVLAATLTALEEMQTPGEVRHLPFTWPDPVSETVTHPEKSPPIVDYLKWHPWELPKLFKRDVSNS